MRLLSRYNNEAYALMRIVLGLLFSFHGVQKIFGFLSEFQAVLGTQVWFGGMIELICGLLIAVGFQTRCAAFLSSGTMAVAYIQFHWKFQFGADLLPVINKGELAVVYCFIFLFIASQGGVIWCLDKQNRLIPESE